MRKVRAPTPENPSPGFQAYKLSDFQAPHPEAETYTNTDFPRNQLLRTNQQEQPSHVSKHSANTSDNTHQAPSCTGKTAPPAEFPLPASRAQRVFYSFFHPPHSP